MSTWNYRAVKKQIGKNEKLIYYEVHEIFYNEKGKPCAMSETPVTYAGETIKDIITEMEQIKKDLERTPVFIIPKKWSKFGFEQEIKKIEKNKFKPLTIEDIVKEAGSEDGS